MAVKSTKEKKTATPKNGVVKAEKSRSSKKKEEEDTNASDDDDDLDETETDDWEKAEEEEDSWDPDFAEFDMPKPTKKAGKAKKGEEEDAHTSDGADDLDLDLNLEDDDLFDDKDEFDDDF